jgi:hypothetical protein
MNKMIGFLGSYTLGFPPSRMPPWGVARRVDDGVAAVEATVEALMLEVVVMIAGTAEAVVRCAARRNVGPDGLL